MVRYKYIKILLMLKGFTFHSPAPIPRPLLGLEGSKYNSCSGGLFVNPASTYRREVWVCGGQKASFAPECFLEEKI